MALGSSLAWCLGILLLTAGAAEGQADSGYVGAEACAKCHAGIHREWAESRHSRMMQAATKQSVLGDFGQGRVVLHGSAYGLRQDGGAYYITESDLTGKPWEHRVEFTLGGRRVQHYLTTLPDGRIILIPSAWDVANKAWVHDVDVGNPEELAGDRILVWNKTCYGCHVSREKKGFDLEHLRYKTTWQNFGVNCESCHGPGKEHAARAKGAIVNPAKLDPMRSTMICAQCHSIRDIYADGFAAGANYYDHFLPSMEYRLAASEDPPFWADGRPRWFANDAVGTWQSQCFLKGGAACVTCHSQSHNLDVERPDVERDARLRNAVCTKCHAAIATDVSKHTHHKAESGGSSCVECHMPATVFSLKARMRDHSIGIPVPENTVRHGIPNACNLCHQDQDAEWSVRQMESWYGSKSRQRLIRRADAFTEARKGNDAAIPALLAIMSDASEGEWVRANAAGYLGGFSDNPSAYDALRRAFSDPEALVRATAAAAIRPSRGQRAAESAELLPLLNDPVLTVRMSAAIALVANGVRPFPGEDGARFEEAKELYRARAGLYPDDAGQQLAAGKFFFLAGDLEGAVVGFRASLKLEPATSTQYLLARALAAKGDLKEARALAKSIPRNDPGYESTQSLLAEIDAKEAEAQNGSGPQGRFREGQLQYQNRYYGAALKYFDEALRAAPQAEWSMKAQIYRAICLEKLARTSEAEVAMKALFLKPGGQQDVDLQLAYVELLLDTGRVEQAQKKVDEVIAAAPNAPLAFFWRARVMLQLHRPADAAMAAEESIRLLPEQPQAHNLLIRIYQMQGRTKEAAQQVEWLRDYQRRTASR